MPNANEVRIEISANAARLKRDMAEARSTVDAAARDMGSAFSALRGTLGVLGVSFGAVQVASFAKSLINAQDEIGKLAQKTNMSVEQTAGWAHALELANVGQEALQKTAKALGTQMLDASKGAADAKQNFAALDIDIKNNDGSLKSVNAVLLEVADRYARATDKTAAAAMMNKVLGKSALDLIPAFKDGRAALEAMIEEGKRLNPVTEESARQAEQFNDNVTRLSKSIKSGFILAMNEALPRMAAISDEFVREAAEGSKVLAVIKGIAQGLNWSDPALIKQQKELIALAQKREDINANIERLRAKGPNWADPVKQQMGELAKLDARAKALSAMIDPVNPKNYDARDLAVHGNRPGFVVDTTDTAAATAAAKKALEERKKLLAEHKKDEIAYYNAIVDADFDATKQIAEDQIAAAKAGQEEIKQLLAMHAKGEVDALIERDKRMKGEMEAVLEFTNSNKTATNEITEFWRSAAQSMQASMSDFFFDVVQGNLTNLGASFKRTVDRMTADMLAAKAATALVGADFGKGGDIGGLIGAGLKGIGLGGGGGASTAGMSNGTFGAAVAGMPAYASGGSFTVGGSGGTDSKLVSFMATPGERVNVQTPAQQGGGGNTYIIDARGADAGMEQRIIRGVMAVAGPGVVERRAINAFSQARARGG